MKNVLTSSKKLISLKGKKALITGSAVGIGKAIACRFAEAGADLYLVDINQKNLETTRDELVHFKREIATYVVDLSRKEQIDELWNELDGREPDILINNAGIYPFKSFLEVDDSFLDYVMDSNLNSVLWMCQQMIRRRLRQGGVIVNIGSIESIMPFKEDLVPYGISKIGVIALTRALAKEYGKNGFRVNAIIPGGIVTPGTREVAKDITKFKFGLLKTGLEFKWRLPIDRAGQPDEIARMVLVLASDLSSYVQGALIPVDGGFLSS